MAPCSAEKCTPAAAIGILPPQWSVDYAAHFAKFFGAFEHGHLAGLLHDLGKAEDKFQQRIALARSDATVPRTTQTNDEKLLFFANP